MEVVTSLHCGWDQMFIRADTPSCADSVVPISGMHGVSTAVLCTENARPGHLMVWAEEETGK